MGTKIRVGPPVPCEPTLMIRVGLDILHREISRLVEVRRELENVINPILRRDPIEAASDSKTEDYSAVRMTADMEKLFDRVRSVICDMNKMINRLD